MSVTQIEAARELAAYLKHRAQAEGVEFKLTPEWFVQETKKMGCSIFDAKLFGIRLNERNGKVESDEQQPIPRFLDEWNTRAVN